MGQEHQGLQVTGIQDHMGDTSPMGLVPGGFYFRMFQIASDHGRVLSHGSSNSGILIENGGRNQNEVDSNEKNEGRMIEQKGLLGYGKASPDFHESPLEKYDLLSKNLWTFSEISIEE